MILFEENIPVTKEHLIEVYRKQLDGLVPSSKIAVFLDGKIGSAIGAMIASELVGRQNVLAVTCPNLCDEKKPENDAIISQYCGEHKCVPITMVIADMMNELRNADVLITDPSVFSVFEGYARSMVGSALKAQGYVIIPGFHFQCSVDDFIAFATEAELPQIIVDAAIKEVSGE